VVHEQILGLHTVVLAGNKEQGHTHRRVVEGMCYDVEMKQDVVVVVVVADFQATVDNEDVHKVVLTVVLAVHREPDTPEAPIAGKVDLHILHQSHALLVHEGGQDT